MYEYIKGILTKITAKYIVVETAGIGYLLSQSLCLLWQNESRGARLSAPSGS